MMTELHNPIKRKSISVIICTRNRSKDLGNCIDSIMNQTHLPNEIVVVDSSDDKSTIRLIEGYEAKALVPIKYVHSTPGLTKQRNIGISVSKGDIVAFLDDDIILDQNFFFEIIKCFMMSDDVFGVGGRLVNLDHISTFGKHFRMLFMLSVSDGTHGFMKRSGFASFQMGENLTSINETEILCGCSCFKRDVFQEYEFDEYFEGYGYMEDVDFSYRVSRRYRLLNTPSAKFIHNHSPNARLDLQNLYQMRVLNHYYVFSKNLKKRGFDWFFFWWSDFGFFLTTLIYSKKIKNWLPLVGIYLGHKKVLMRMFGSKRYGKGI